AHQITAKLDEFCHHGAQVLVVARVFSRITESRADVRTDSDGICSGNFTNCADSFELFGDAAVKRGIAQPVGQKDPHRDFIGFASDRTAASGFVWDQNPADSLLSLMAPAAQNSGQYVNRILHLRRSLGMYE